MILVACLNPALDVTYQVPTVTLGASHRIRAVTVRAGGKGTNVARILVQLGTPVTLLTATGGTTGGAFTADLETDRLAPARVLLHGETRRTVTVVSTEGATVLNEPGPVVTADEWHLLRNRFAELAVTATGVVLTGSLPPGIPVDAYAQLTGLAQDAGLPVVLDADGSALTAALPAAPTLVKVNAAEAADGLGLSPAGDLAAGLVEAGAVGAVVTHGADGLSALLRGHHLRAWLPRPVEGNPTGAGDALTAVLADQLHRGSDWRSALPFAVAVAAAAVAVPYAGAYDERLAAELVADVQVEERG